MFINLEQIYNVWRSISDKLDETLSTQRVNYYMGTEEDEFPVNPNKGDEFLNTDNGREYVFDGQGWEPK